MPILLTVFVACSGRRQERLLQEGDQRIAAGEYVAAAEAFRKVISINPESAAGIRSVYKLAFLLETFFKDYEGALINYREFVRLTKDPLRTYEVRKRVANIQFEHLRDFEAAAKAYDALAREEASSPETDFFLFRTGQAFFQLNRFEEALGAYQKLLETHLKSPLAARARFEVGNTYYMEGKYDVAVQAFKQVLRLHPQSQYAVEAQFLMGECLEQQGNDTEALQVYQNLRGRYTPKDVLELRIKKLEGQSKERKSG